MKFVVVQLNVDSWAKILVPPSLKFHNRTDINKQYQNPTKLSGVSYACNVQVCNKSMCNIIRQVTTKLPRRRCCIHCNRIHITSYVTNKNTAVCCIFAYKNRSLTYIQMHFRPNVHTQGTIHILRKDLQGRRGVRKCQFQLFSVLKHAYVGGSKNVLT